MISVSMTIRMTRQQQDLIDAAARLSGTNRGDFILEHAIYRAREVLMDNALMSLPDATRDSLLTSLADRTLTDQEATALLSGEK